MEGRRNSWCCTDYLTLDNGRMAILLPAFNLPGKSPLCDRRGLEWILRRQVIEPLPNIRDLMMIPIVFLLHFKAWHNNKTFAFIWNFSSHSTRLKKPTNTQLTSDWKLILLNENSLKKNSSSSTPATRLLLPNLLFAPLLACRLAKGGGTSYLVYFNHFPAPCTAFSQKKTDWTSLDFYQSLFQISKFPHLSICPLNQISEDKPKFSDFFPSTWGHDAMCIALNNL